jgi:hypothetical protein
MYVINLQIYPKPCLWLKIRNLPEIFLKKKIDVGPNFINNIKPILIKL